MRRREGDTTLGHTNQDALERAPKDFVGRYEALLEGQFTPEGRGRVVDELTLLVEEVEQLFLPHC